MKLYEISEQYLSVMENLEVDENGEITNIDDFVSIDAEFDEKVDNIACLIKELQAEAEAIKQEEKTLKERREVKERKAQSIKDFLQKYMLVVGKTKVETPRNVLSFRKSQKLEVTDEAFFMEKYPELVKTEVVKSIPKKEVTDLIKQGKEFVGVKLVENLNLQIK